jgi:outer membrane protein OmpA-like peptidoglycan-associated protein
VIHVTSDRPERIERFSLILFGFDESQLSAGNDRSIQSAADMMLKVPVTRVLIQGFTDEMGDRSHNDELSKARADNVRTQFEELLRAEGRNPSALDIHSQGRGSRELPYDNNLPEGRFFSRTVNITIERGP